MIPGFLTSNLDGLRKVSGGSFQASPGSSPLGTAPCPGPTFCPNTTFFYSPRSYARYLSGTLLMVKGLAVKDPSPPDSLEHRLSAEALITLRLRIDQNFGSFRFFSGSGFQVNVAPRPAWATACGLFTVVNLGPDPHSSSSNSPLGFGPLVSLGLVIFCSVCPLRVVGGFDTPPPDSARWDALFQVWCVPHPLTPFFSPVPSDGTWRAFATLFFPASVPRPVRGSFPVVRRPWGWSPLAASTPGFPVPLRPLVSSPFWPVEGVISTPDSLFFIFYIFSLPFWFFSSGLPLPPTFSLASGVLVGLQKGPPQSCFLFTPQHDFCPVRPQVRFFRYRSLCPPLCPDELFYRCGSVPDPLFVPIPLSTSFCLEAGAGPS